MTNLEPPRENAASRSDSAPGGGWLDESPAARSAPAVRAPGKARRADHPPAPDGPAGARRAAERADAGGGGEMKGYLVIFEPTETGFSAYAPDLLGCVTTGRTRPEAETNIREAVEFHLAGL